MDANKAIAGLLMAAALGIAPQLTCAQTPSNPRPHSSGTIRHSRIVEDATGEAVSPQVIEAEAALDKKDYSRAEELLSAATDSTHPDARSYRAWFDFGRLYTETNRKQSAIQAYQRSVAIKPDLLESNLNLGLLLAASGGKAEAIKYLQAATTLKPLNTSTAKEEQFAAWYALGHLQQSDEPQQSLNAYQQAILLEPRDVDSHLGAAQILDRQNNFAEAEREYKQALELDSKSSDALTGLANLYISAKKLPQAEATLRAFAKLNPQNAAAHVQLGRILEAENRTDEALTEFETASKISPSDPNALRAMAGLAASAKKYDQAENEYRALLNENPNQADLHYALGTVYMNQHKMPQAEQELLAALKLKPSLADAYGNLAVVAGENQHYLLVLKALDARAKFLPEDAGSYFLRATSYDHMRAYKDAALNYHLFLSADAGKLPDQEWQARHRLIAIEPKK